MPVVLREGPYKVHIYSREGREPAHVHVWRDGRQAKFWLAPLAIADAGRFKPMEVRQMRRMLVPHEPMLLREWEAWHG